MSLTLVFNVDIDTILTPADSFIPIDSIRVSTVTEQGRRPAHIFFSSITTDGGEYPETTETKCWWCRYGFSEKPIGKPVAYVKERKAFICNGIFCSFPCLRAYIKDKNEDETLLTDIYLKSGGILPIQTAKSWKELVDYGGTLTIDKFKESFKRVEVSALLLSSSTAFMSVDAK